MPKKEKIPPPGGKKCEFTSFYSKAKWKQFFLKSTLEVAGRNLQHGGAKIVGNALAKNKWVTKLDFSHNHLGDKGAIELAQILKVNDILQDVNLSCNGISDVGGIAIACAFVPCANPTGGPSQWNRSVYYLSLMGNDLRDDSLIALANAAACNRDLAKLDLSKNKIGGFGCKALMRSMQRNNLCNIKLDTNCIGDEGVEHLCAAWMRFGGKGAQAVLNLTNNGFALGGANAVGLLLQNTDFVQDVNLSWNTFGLRGTNALCTKLIDCKSTLRSLNLCHNMLKDEGAVEVAKLIEASLPNLTKLNVSHNMIGDAGGVALGNALSKNTTLTIFSVTHNEFKMAACQAMADALSTSKALKHVYMFGHGLDEKCKTVMSDGLHTGQVDNNGLKCDFGAVEDPTVFPMQPFLEKLGQYLAMVAQEEMDKAAKKPKKKRG